MSPTQIDLCWDKIEGAKKYWVYVNSKPHKSTTENSITITAKENTTYEIQITAQLSDLTILSLDDADVVTVTTPVVETLKKVPNVSVQAVSSDMIKVQWDVLEAGTRYYVYVDSILYKVTTDNRAFLTLDEGNTYKIYVTAILPDSTIFLEKDADVITITLRESETTAPDNPVIIHTNNVKKAQTDSTLTLSVISDMHLDDSDSYNVASRFSNIKTLGNATQLADIDFVVNLGDNIVGDAKKEYSLSSMNTLIDKIEESCAVPVLYSRGNHDDNGWYSLYGNGGSFMADEMINDVEWQEIIDDTLPQGFIKDPKKPNGGYGYIDHEESKIRIFILNSCDIPYILNDDGSYRYTSYRGHAFSNEQINFVAQSLMFEDKEKPSDWAAVFLTHVPLDSSNADGERFGGLSALIRGYDYMLSVISAYRKGTSFKKSGTVYNQSIGDKKEDFLIDVDIDYSKKGCGEVIAFFNGHTHSNNYTNSAGIKNSLSYGYTYIGTVGSESFTTYVINREECTISAFTYGKARMEETAGNIVGVPHTGSIESGVWTVKYDQFLPNGENIYNGKSEIHPLYFDFGATPLKADIQTMEVMSVTQSKAARQLTKLIPVKPMTKYILPSDFAGQCLSFAKSGDSRAYLSVNSEDDYKYFETGERTTYVAFSLDTSFYKDYENFFVKEVQYGVEY